MSETSKKTDTNIQEERLRIILHNLDWIKILDTAIKRRTTSWNFGSYSHPVIEWRNASDEICMAVINALEDKEVLEDMFNKIKKMDLQREKKIIKQETLAEVEKIIEDLIDHYEPYRPLTDSLKMEGAREGLSELKQKLKEIRK